MEPNHDDIAAEIVADLEHRVKRLEFYLTGALELDDVAKDASLRPSLSTRLKTIEETINKAASQRRAVSGMLQLYIDFPELFPSDTLTPSDLSADDQEHEDETTLKQQLTVVDACATMFPSAVSRLNLLKDSPMPHSHTTASLLSLKPRLNRAEMVQDSLAADLAELRLRTVLLLQRWVKVGIQAAGHCWADWEERLLDVERLVRRTERAKAQEEQD